MKKTEYENAFRELCAPLNNVSFLAMEADGGAEKNEACVSVGESDVLMPADGYYAFVVLEKRLFCYQGEDCPGRPIFIKPVTLKSQSEWVNGRTFFNSNHNEITVKLLLALGGGKRSDWTYSGGFYLDAGVSKAAGECVIRKGNIVYLTDQCGSLRRQNSSLKIMRNIFQQAILGVSHAMLMPCHYHQQASMQIILYACFSSTAIKYMDEMYLQKLQNEYQNGMSILRGCLTAWSGGVGNSVRLTDQGQYRKGKSALSLAVPHRQTGEIKLSDVQGKETKQGERLREQSLKADSKRRNASSGCFSWLRTCYQTPHVVSVDHAVMSHEAGV